MSSPEDTRTSSEKNTAVYEEKIALAKDLYNRGSRNYLVKDYGAAADDLSQVCALYGDLYGEISDEVAMPYLLYAKALIALGTEENKILDVPDEEGDDDEDDDEVDESEAKPNGVEKKLETVDEGEADSTEGGEKKEGEKKTEEKDEENEKEGEVSSSADAPKANGTVNGVDHAKPGTSNGAAGGESPAAEEDEDDFDAAAANNLQLAWEILEIAAKIFAHQGEEAMPNLAECHTELGNIQFENNVLEAAREDYGKSLQVYEDLPGNYRRAMAEIHYKIGLSYLMETMNKEGAESLKKACELIDAEIAEMKAKENLTEKDKNNIQDMEETKQEIWDKITEIEDTKKQNLQSVRAALDTFMSPAKAASDDGAGPSSSSSAGPSSSSKATDISHLIKRKKPDTPPSGEAEASSPAKRPAL